MTALRPFFWNIEPVWLFYVLALIAAILFGLGLSHHISRWLTGRRDDAYKKLNIKSFMVNGLLNARLWKDDPSAGIFHLSLMWGFILLFLGTALLSVHEYIRPVLQGKFYLGYALVLDLAGILFLIGVLLAGGRRYIWKRNQMTATLHDALVLIFLLLIGLTGFLVEGARLAVNPGPDLAWSPVGAALGAWLPHGSSGGLRVYRVLWWVHALLGLGFVGGFVYLKLFHVIATPINFLWTGRPRRCLTMDQREEEGREFDLGHLVMSDACTRCNRCEQVCPSWAAGEGLSPRDFVQRVRQYTHLKYTWLNRLPWYRRRAVQTLTRDPRVDPDLAWLCTTCRACAEVCPGQVEPLTLIGSVRSTVIEEGRQTPALMARALEGVQKQGNPWLRPRSKRGDWAKGLEAKLAGEDEFEWLYFAGCTVSFDARLMDLARSAVEVFQRAGVDLAVLGREEPCCGDMPRRAGEDGLFEMLVEENLELFAELEIKKIVTASPHCAETLKNGYPAMAEALGLDSTRPEVRHYSELLAELLREGRLNFTQAIKKKVTYHDPCYLGRHQGIFEAPRAIIGGIPGLTLIEMARCREKSFCCGGGGGRMWSEVEAETKISEIRAREAAETGAEILATACPYCLAMLTDAVKTANLADRIEVLDLMELVLMALGE